MPLEFDDRGVRLTGNVSIDDLDALAAWTPAHDAEGVDLSACRHLHAAVLQQVLARRLRVLALPDNAILAAAIEAATTHG
jgi:hypothetical protein